MNHYPSAMDRYLKHPVSNGVAREQALIRRWWQEKQQGTGVLVWEYYLEGCFLDAVWFPQGVPFGQETPGKQAPDRFPLAGQPVVLCEAKLKFTPELIGQALTYRQFVLEAGAELLDTVVFSETASAPLIRAAQNLGLTVAVAQKAQQ